MNQDEIKIKDIEDLMPRLKSSRACIVLSIGGVGGDAALIEGALGDLIYLKEVLNIVISDMTLKRTREIYKL